MIKQIINWTNENSGFLALTLFVLSIVYGWLSGLFKSLIRKPKLKVRFIDKMTFYSFFYTGEKWYNEEINEEFELHNTGFVVYFSIANVGSKPTSIDKIWLGYKRNTTGRQLFKKNIQWIPLLHPGENFKIEYTNDMIVIISNIVTRSSEYDYNYQRDLGIGSSVVGTAYFEQGSSWGNFNPKQGYGGIIDAIIKINDIYGKVYKFKTKLKQLPIEKARKYNQHFGKMSQLRQC
ncbi:MAG: hypothetical protein K8S00_00720 [Bacteroidales bacterium]|nr:hypothetical protein [Bacteroidales bacterium]